MSSKSVVFKNFHPSPAGLAPLTQMPPRRQLAPPQSPSAPLSSPRAQQQHQQQPSLQAQRQQPQSPSQPPASPGHLSTNGAGLSLHVNGNTQPTDQLAILPAASFSSSTSNASEIINTSTAHDGRTLPSRSVSGDEMEDAYVQFIFCCNPTIATTQDTGELRRGFRSVPRSDGRSFDATTLFTLIRRLEARELESWAQLVVEMGVEPPDVTRSQSTQKVQQFAVRLKRWLHAFHIDAFFYYLLGKPCIYYTQIPSETQPIAGNIRDGVPPEEDLAIRALLPEWRPKRGRRKADPAHDLNGSPATKRSARRGSVTGATTTMDEASAASPESNTTAHPQSSNWPQFGDLFARAEDALMVNKDNREWIHKPTHLAAGDEYVFWVEEADESLPPNSAPPHSAFPHSALPLSAAPRSAPPQSAFPQSAHPQSAIIPRSALLAPDVLRSPHPFSAAPATPRKRHGSVVSAAWRSSTQSGKIRGRPPASRSQQDGSFSTFPANPWPTSSQRNVSVGGASSGPPVASVSAASTAATAPTTASTISTSQSSSAQASMTLLAQSNNQNHYQSSNGLANSISSNKKPGKLQLQVPPHQGGPVRLATPPPPRRQHLSSSSARSPLNGDANAASSSKAAKRPNATTTRTTKAKQIAVKAAGVGGAAGSHERQTSSSSFTTMGYGDGEGGEEDADAEPDAVAADADADPEADAEADADADAEHESIEFAEMDDDDDDDGVDDMNGNGILDHESGSTLGGNPVMGRNGTAEPYDGEEEDRLEAARALVGKKVEREGGGAEGSKEESHGGGDVSEKREERKRKRGRRADLVCHLTARDPLAMGFYLLEILLIAYGRRERICISIIAQIENHLYSDSNLDEALMISGGRAVGGIPVPIAATAAAAADI